MHSIIYMNIFIRTKYNKLTYSQLVHPLHRYSIKASISSALKLFAWFGRYDIGSHLEIHDDIHDTDFRCVSECYICDGW